MRGPGCCLPFTLSAALTLALYIYFPRDNDTIQHVLSNVLRQLTGDAMVPPEVITMMLWALPFIAFGVVFACVQCVLECLGGDGMIAYKPAREEVVPLGIPVQTNDEATPYVAMPAAGGGASGQWADGLCACFNDLGLTCVGCCCPCVTVGQLYERVYHQRHSCVAIVVIFVLAHALASALGAAHCPQPVRCDYDNGVRCESIARLEHQSLACQLGSGLTTAATLFLVALLVMVRSHLRSVFRIPPSCCGPCDDLCCAFCCSPLVSCQMLRHLSVVSGTAYKFDSTTGTAVEV